MKTILVDAIDCFIHEDGTYDPAMYSLLETYENPKLVLTGADDSQFKEFNLAVSPYEVFTLKHSPEKTDPAYYKKLLSSYNLQVKDVIYFEHNPDACKAAQSLGIITYFYDYSNKDYNTLKEFIDNNL